MNLNPQNARRPAETGQNQNAEPLATRAANLIYLGKMHRHQISQSKARFAEVPDCIGNTVVKNNLGLSSSQTIYYLKNNSWTGPEK
jgi:hypothetical protein